MRAAQARMVGVLEKLRREHRDSSIAVFSHGDPIRSVLCWYLAMPLDFLLRLAIVPASVSVLAIDDWGPQLKAFNLTFDPEG